MKEPFDFSIDLRLFRQQTQNAPKSPHKTIVNSSYIPEVTEQFCSDFLHLEMLMKVGKRMIDPNVVTFNSTQKQMVQTIVETNSKRSDDKSKFLTQRANKFLRILWKAEKYNDLIAPKLISSKSPEKIPNYASPIHNFKRHKYTANNSFGSYSNDKNSPKSISIPNKSPPHKISTKATIKNETNRTETSRVKKFNSVERKFDKIRLSPKGRKIRIRDSSRDPYLKKPISLSGEKEFQIDLSNNITLNTMVHTKKFENMLQILKQK